MVLSKVIIGSRAAHTELAHISVARENVVELSQNLNRWGNR